MPDSTEMLRLTWRGHEGVLSGYDPQGKRRAMITVDPGPNGRYAGWLESNPTARQLRDNDVDYIKAFLEGLWLGELRDA